MARSLTKALSAPTKIPYGVLIGLGAKELYVQTRIGGLWGSSGWEYGERSRAEDGSFSYCVAGWDSCDPVLAGIFITHYSYSWAIPSGAEIKSVTMRAKGYSTDGTHRWCMRASWNGGTNYTDTSVGYFPTSNGWMEYDATQGHPNWTVSELAALRTNFFSFDATAGKRDYLDVLTVVVVYEA